MSLQVHPTTVHGGAYGETPHWEDFVKFDQNNALSMLLFNFGGKLLDSECPSLGDTSGDVTNVFVY